MQALPRSTEAVAIDIRRTGALAHSALLRREGSATSAVMNVRLSPGNSYQVDVAAYREADPDPGASAVATGSISDLRIEVGRRSQRELFLSPTYAPALEALVPDIGLAGHIVRLRGVNLDLPWASASVRFGPADAIVVAASPTGLSVVVPPGQSAPVEVDVDGVVTSSDTPFVYGARLTAVQPGLAQVGAILRLDGLFGTEATVHFPGGVDVPATVAGSQRASVVVPAGATAGPLSLTSGGQVTAGLVFRTTTFDPALGPFRGPHESLNQPARRADMIDYRSLHTATNLGSTLCVTGGYNETVTVLDSVEVATVHADGTFGSFRQVPELSLRSPRSGHAAVLVGDWLFLVGGYRDGSDRLGEWPGPEIERAPIGAGSVPGPFEAVDRSPSIRRAGHAAAVIGNYVYLLGGESASGIESSVERAPVLADGNLGDFENAGVTLQERRSRPALAILGDYLYLLGGKGNATTLLSSVERSRIGSDGILGPFEGVAASLTSPRQGCGSVVLGDAVYVLGGGDSSGYLTDVQRSAIDMDGNLGAFAQVPDVNLRRARYGGGLVQTGNFVHVLGGYDSEDLNKRDHESAWIAGSDLGGPTEPGPWLGGERSGHCQAVLGNWLYVLGGYSGSDGYLTSVERAPVAVDGSLGTFEPVPGVALQQGRDGPACGVTGPYLYVIGGRGPADLLLGSVERAPISPGGELGAFETVSSIALESARMNPVCLVGTRYLAVVGGYGEYETIFGTAYAQLASVEEARIGADGSLGPFSNPGPYLEKARDMHAGIVVGDYHYVAGGGGAEPVASIERAPIDPQLGYLSGAFALLSAPRLVSPRFYQSLARIGTYVYVTGGMDESNVYYRSVDRSPISPSGDLGDFEALPDLSLRTSRVDHTTVVVGNRVHFVGGISKSSTEWATIR